MDHLRANLLRALEEVAFNHDALDEFVYGGVVGTAVQHLADDLNGKFNHLVEDVQVLVDNTLAYFGAKKK